MTRHPVDLLSFVFGVLLLGVGLLLLSGDIGQVPLEWAGPAVAIGLGVLILGAARPSRSAPPPTAEPKAQIPGN